MLISKCLTNISQHTYRCKRGIDNALIVLCNPMAPPIDKKRRCWQKDISVYKKICCCCQKSQCWQKKTSLLGEKVKRHFVGKRKTSYPCPCPWGCAAPPDHGLPPPPLAVVTYESTREPKDASTKGILWTYAARPPTARVCWYILSLLCSPLLALLCFNMWPPQVGGAASPGLGGQRTPRGKGKDMGKNKWNIMNI